MPCYLFTFHGYGTWMPDRPQGYVHRQKGLLPSDAKMAQLYRDKQNKEAVWFDSPMQQLVVDTICAADAALQMTVHAVATDPTHVHILVSWSSDKQWLWARRNLRYSLTRALNQRFGKRQWLAAKGSRKRVKDREHFEHLVTTYLPKHNGVVWVNDKS